VNKEARTWAEEHIDFFQKFYVRPKYFTGKINTLNFDKPEEAIEMLASLYSEWKEGEDE